MNITEPTLVIDESRCKRNISTMVEKASRNGLVLRPHFKTHQSRAVGEWFREAGVSAITVSSLGMAQYFADAGWQEITVAFPVNIKKPDAINHLAEKIKLNLLVGSEDALTKLDAQLRHSVSVYIEIDSGSDRSGISHTNKEQILALKEAVEASSMVNLKGFYSHAGHTYEAQSANKIDQIAGKAKQAFLSVRDYVAGSDALEFCWGDTPSCSHWDSFEGFDAISPGNFVFYDVMQCEIGSCKLEQVAVAMYCPIVQKKADKNELCIHGGGVHFSKDHIQLSGEKSFGLAVDASWQPLANSWMRALSQEHGIVRVSADDFDKFEVGDTLVILPVHSCLTAEAMGRYLTKNEAVLDHYAQKNRDLVTV